MTASDTARRRTREPPPPTRSESIQLRWRAARSSALLPMTAAVVAALLLGGLVGRATAPTVDDTGLASLERQVLPLVVDADAVWTVGIDGAPGVGRQLQAFRAEGDVDALDPHIGTWLEAHDTVLRRIVGIEVPASVRPIQRQFVAAVTLSRDAVELVAEAADTSDPAVQRDLSSEAVRLRIRSEQLTQSAQAAVTDLRGATTSGVSVPPAVPSLTELR